MCQIVQELFLVTAVHIYILNNSLWWSVTRLAFLWKKKQKKIETKFSFSVWVHMVYFVCIFTSTDLIFFSYFLTSKYWQDFKGDVTSAGDPRHRGRGHRFLPWPGALWTLSAPSGAALGGGGWTQRRRALRTVLGETQTVCRTWAGQLVEELK